MTNFIKGLKVMISERGMRVSKRKRDAVAGREGKERTKVDQGAEPGMREQRKEKRFSDGGNERLLGTKRTYGKVIFSLKFSA